MLDKDIIKIAHDRIGLEIEDQAVLLRNDITRVLTEMGDIGIVDSGETKTKIVTLFTQSIRNRAQLVWQTLFRFITTSVR